MKIIPAIDLMQGQVVRLFKGDPNQKTIYSKDPVETARKWEKAGADMLHIVDLDATLGRGSNFEIFKKISKEIRIPVQVAGGLRDEPIIQQASSTSDRIVLGTVAFKDQKLLKKLADSIGIKKMVISVDHVDGQVVINGWQKNTGLNVFDSVNEFAKMGFTEFLVTNVSRDGTLEGPDLDTLAKLCKVEGTNIIASGGISNLDDVKSVKKINAFGVILGRSLYENKLSVEEAKSIS